MRKLVCKHGSVYLSPYGIHSCSGIEPVFLSLTVMMHVLPISLSPPILSVPPFSLQPAFTICFGSSPFCLLIFFPLSSCVLCTVHPPSSFVCLSPAPSIVSSVPPISALVLPSDPTPCPSPVPPADGDPKSPCSPLDCSPFKFFWVANNCCQQVPHKIPAWLLLWGLQWHTGCNGCWQHKGLGLWAAFSCV